MKRGWIGVTVIVAMAAGVLVVKQIRAASPASAAPEITAAPAATTQTQVLLFADQGMAEMTCGCGLVFRAVRGAAARGVSVREVDPERDQDLVKQHRVTVEPTVLVLDAQGRELRRHEGETPDVLAAIRGDLEGIAQK
jgi:hypothetical protein